MLLPNECGVCGAGVVRREHADWCSWINESVVESRTSPYDRTHEDRSVVWNLLRSEDIVTLEYLGVDPFSDPTFDAVCERMGIPA